MKSEDRANFQCRNKAVRTSKGLADVVIKTKFLSLSFRLTLESSAEWIHTGR